MLQSFVFVICIFELASMVQGQPGGQVEKIFAGERQSCHGLAADVDVQHAFVEVNNTEIVLAVAESFANAMSSSEGAIAESHSIGEKILHVTAEAVAKISAQVNSPNPGCWAIAYGKAEAQAIATAIVEAIAEGIAYAFSPELFTDAAAFATTRVESISEAVASVSLLLAKGDGSGYHSMQGTANATAKASAINCAFAQAFAQVYKNNTATAYTIVQAGCSTSHGLRLERLDTGKQGLDAACQCINMSGQRWFGGCGAWGGADQICYVKDPKRCMCAQESVTRRGQKWRFCGETLKTMKSWLQYEDEYGEFEKIAAGFGYCPAMEACDVFAPGYGCFQQQLFFSEQ